MIAKYWVLLPNSPQAFRVSVIPAPFAQGCDGLRGGCCLTHCCSSTHVWSDESDQGSQQSSSLSIRNGPVHIRGQDICGQRTASGELSKKLDRWHVSPVLGNRVCLVYPMQCVSLDMTSIMQYIGLRTLVLAHCKKFDCKLCGDI